MDRPKWSPTVVVGVDFGMTCTGVAYSTEDSGWARPEIIQRWPDKENKLFNKFPSRVAYDKTQELVDWGRCNRSPDIETKESEFKLYLDPAFRDGTEDSLSHDDAVRFYVDYMTALNNHVDEVLIQRIPRWRDRNVEFRFSIPTTWKNARHTAQLKSWLAAAGFHNTATRRVIFSRTEAEAAAVYVANQYQQGDVIMVVDAGGATTDLNVLEIIQKQGEVTRMEALDKAEGVNVGSVMIDVDARKVIEEKLRALHLHASNDIKWIAETMMERNRFDYFKHNFDNRSIMDFYMEIPKRDDHQVTLKCSELRQIFDTLVDELIRTISEKILILSRTNPDKMLRKIVLSGGLGSSEYVRERLIAEFCDGRRLSNAPNLEVLVVAEPQLAVVKGLVMDRAQALNTGIEVYHGRCCRVSYGVLCRLPYKKEKHFGEPTIRDPISGDMWVEDQIDWLIKEGQRVPDEGVSKAYSLRLTPDKRFELFKAHIVMSESPALDLPRSLLRGPVDKLCTVEGTFSAEDFGFGNSKNVTNFWGIRKKKDYEVAEFRLKVNVGSTDLGFELVSLDGKRFSEGTEKFKVIWDDYKPPPTKSKSGNDIFPVISK